MTKITVNDVLTASGRYPERATRPECTDVIKANAQALCNKVNAFLDELGYTGKRDVTSGFRPLSVNEVTSNAGKKSHHLTGNALDILDDKDQTLAKLAESRSDLLEKYGLYMEDHRNTKGKNTNWFHVQVLPPKSGKRVFLAKAIT
jgi:hypothetical protein